MTSFNQIEHATKTDVGVRRNHNQDAHCVLLATDKDSWRERGHVFLVADGMGAHAVGEMASAMACSIIPHTYHKHAKDGVVQALRRAFVEANAEIHGRGQANREFQGMGTTSTALVLRPEGAWIGHVGDSRAYRIRGGNVEQLTFDHSLVWEKARRAKVRPEDLKDVPSNVIVRSMGPDAEVEVDIRGPHPVQDGDTFLICSDGLSGPMSDPEMGAIASVLNPAEACQLLVDLTNLRGGPDNITVVIVRVGPSKSTDDDDDGPVKPSLLRRVPWPFWIILAGIALSGGAAALIYNKLAGGQMLFLFAALTIIGGLAGLFVYHAQEKKRRESEPEEYRPRTKVYRQAECKIERGLLEKMQQLETALVAQAQEKQWEVNWDVHHRHQQLATRLLSQNNVAGAFRETCRGMRPLTEALERSRNKEEKFQPNWDKPRK
ncbi:MAG: protein phosphatase 2C domain-containing protein [Gemmataceae bacterium]|nr:protein phosphatase 2C domain-containing protein [Gemmataceae bacterium]